MIESGTVLVLDLPAGAAALHRRVGYRTQAPAVYRDLTVEENLQYFAALHGARPGAVERTLEHVNLVELRRDVAAQLSGGQLGALATALHAAASAPSAGKATPSIASHRSALRLLIRRARSCVRSLRRPVRTAASSCRSSAGGRIATHWRGDRRTAALLGRRSKVP